MYDEDAYAVPRFGNYYIGVLCALIGLPARVFRRVGVRSLGQISPDVIMIEQAKIFIPLFVIMILCYFVFFFETASQLFKYSGE